MGAWNALIVARTGRFNELRKVRNKPKAAGTERPFSRMYNFFQLEQGDKWAKTGTKFKPRTASGYPRPESAKASEAKKEARKSSASVAPQWSSKATASARGTDPAAVSAARVPEGPKRLVPTSKMTPQAIRPINGRNTNIMGNRPSPPPPSERARLDAMLHEESWSFERMEHLLGKRRRERGDSSAEAEVPQALDLPSSRRLRTVEPVCNPAHQAWAGKELYQHQRARYAYHHHGAVALGEDERAYLNRMRPEVREEVMAPMLQAMRERSQHMETSRYPHDPSTARRRMDIMEAIQHRETYLPAYQSPIRMRLASEHSHAHAGACEPRDDALDHQHDAWEHPEAVRLVADVLPTHAPVDAHEDMLGKEAVMDDDVASINTDPCDGFSSCWSTPDSVPVCNEFVGSPLDLGEAAGLAELLGDEAQEDTTRMKRAEGLDLEDFEGSSWSMSMPEFACQAAW